MAATLAEQVTSAIASGPASRSPLWRWIEEDLVRLTWQQAGENARAAAQRLDLPPSTFRRRLEKALADPVPRRLPTWHRLSSLLQPFADEQLADPQASYVRLRQLLLQQVVSQVTKQRERAALMGISEPTLKRWEAALCLVHE